MSAFLGTIHHWLYNKILFQEGLTSCLAGTAGSAAASELLAKATELFGEPESGELADIIDPTNIHGWLQERVAMVEARLAYVVTSMLGDAPKKLTALTEQAAAYGRSQAANAEQTAEGAYRLLENTLLNGMPCDHVNRIVEQDEASLTWEQTKDIHAAYWQQMDGDPAWYTRLREAVIEGLLTGSGVVCSKTGETVWTLRGR
ncbi:MAG: hypothetical protein SPL15_08305 [Lachnospiraceae bacterium]|nr:hypothetical protein [Lachnospiraceae bacterium]MDY5742977.1 hypothetical protein [Lachnospiraceae bacterium]